MQSDLCPEHVVMAIYNYAVGCFWVKFTPLYASANELL